ncbi:sugar kinase [Photobacterium lutimaris]|uniref:Sugar kinase n=1 Tax=Photobacterium lutimaris TaxID=388278 RepID=A0A2T3J2H2_9GAMM|nr:sugar kinase [Photobacterium lutimaris]PSU35456.1 sugar kinase [Photobacterium lutimaris]TDR78503.1 2-keto-3-deoxygluconate kinase [Photobacterium lutimaris]
MPSSLTFKKKKIALIGECMIELSGQPFAQQAPLFGGDTLNTALYLSRLVPDMLPAYVTALGNDNYSRHMRQCWQQEGMDTQFVLTVDGKLPGLYAIENTPCGDSRFHYWRHDSAARYLCRHEQFSAVVEHLQSFDLVYLSGISLAILPDKDKHLLLRSLATLKEAGVHIAVDSNYRPALWPSSSDACEWIGKLYQMADIALVTADDEDRLLGMRNSPPAIIAKRMHSMGVKQVVVKLGAEGALWSQCGLSGTAKGNKVDQVIDTTAAGDAFNAAYLAAWSMGMDIDECCHWGNKLAARVIQHKGAIISQNFTRYITDLMNI